LCYDEDSYNVNDPLCDSRFQELAKDLPFAHFSNSKLICRISGLKMDTNNPPMVMPNGNVYSWKSMKEISMANNGIITDPKTNEKFNFDQLKKAFIM
jgi:macrophage erythroblast attacher